MLSVWNPFLPVTAIKTDNAISKRDLFDRVFEQTWNDWMKPMTALSGIEYQQTDDNLTVSIDLPGISVDDLTVDVDDHLISIKATRKNGKSSSSIAKSFSVPEGYDLDNIAAELTNGVLTLSLKSIPKPEKNIKKIEVKTSNLLNK